MPGLPARRSLWRSRDPAIHRAERVFMFDGCAGQARASRVGDPQAASRRAQAQKRRGACDKVTRRANTSDLQNFVKPQIQKYFPSYFCKTELYPSPSRPAQGASAVVTTRDGLRWTWKCPDERHGSVRRRRVVLTPRRWCQVLAQRKLRKGDGGKKADHRGDHVISRKAIAQGMSDVLRCPVCSCAPFLSHCA